MWLFSLLTLLLAIAIITSFFAKYHWIADLCRHFKTHYIMIAGILLIISIANGSLLMSAISIAILLVCFLELLFYPHKKIHKNSKKSPQFKIIQFNKFFENKNLDKIHKFIIESDADVIIIQEADTDFAKQEKEINDIYRDIYRDANDHPYGLMIFSKHPFINKEKFPLENVYEKSDGYRIIVQPEGFKEPITVFTVHATNAYPKKSWETRNELLRIGGNHVAESQTNHRIFMGDWNITPYSPFFRDLLQKTKMNIAYNHFIPSPTWPNFSIIPRPLNKIIQIPIDHILFSNSLQPVKRNIGAAFSSDHHVLEMDFVEK